MSVTAVVGANWGDEGKGKIVDALAHDADYVVRFQGGNNAGHSIYNDFGKFVLHLLPSGVFNPNVVNVIGPGVALNVEALFTEIDEILAGGVPQPEIAIADRALVLLPYHMDLDSYEEDRLGLAQYGSTKKGIAPFYADKYLKVGVQVGDLFDPDYLRARVERVLPRTNFLLSQYYGKTEYNVKDVIDYILQFAERLKPLVCATTPLLHKALKEEKTILLEGQLGALRDPDHGIYPYSTSSSTLAGYGAIGAGIPPHAIDRIVAVVKAYSSCVGAGPFVTELANSDGNQLREKGGAEGEYGATTGRPRRVGWFDAVATRYGCMVQGATEVALTILDALGYLDTVPICTAYEIDGQVTTEFPRNAQLDRAKPILQNMPGWKCDIRNVRTFEDLPAEAQDYVREIERLIEVPISMVSVGPHRDALLRVTERAAA